MTAPSRSRQGGFAIPLVVLGVAIALVVMGYLAREYRYYKLAERGKTLSTAVLPWHNGLVMYALANRTALVSTPTGTVTGVASPLAPTCAEMRTLMPSLLDYSCTLPERAGTPTFSVTPIPAGCVSTACDLSIEVTTDAVGVDEDASVIVTQAVSNFGAGGGQSIVGAGSTINGSTWSRANPRGNVARVFGTHETYGASTLSKFLTVFDTRDPNFMNNVTVVGTITSNTDIAVGNSTCKFTELTLDGRLIGRSPTCIARVQSSGLDGSVRTFNSAGTPTTALSDSGLQVFNSAGLDKAGVRFNASVTEAYAERLNLSAVNTAGTSCPAAGTFSRTSTGQLLSCVSGTWQLSGMTTANVGDACVSGLAQDLASTNNALICRNNVYVNLNQAVGLTTLIDSLVVVNGTVVPAPTCAAQATPAILFDVDKFQTPSGGGTFRISYTGTGPWTISITGSGGGEAIAWRACKYASF